MRSSRLGTFTVSVPGDFAWETEALDLAMAICGNYDGPQLPLGGPELPPSTKA